MIKELIKLANELDQRGLAKEAAILDKIMKAAMPSMYEMTQYDEDNAILAKIASLVYKQAFELAGREDEKYLEMDQGMKDEFYEDAKFIVGNLIKEFAKEIKDFNMAPYGSLEGEVPQGYTTGLSEEEAQALIDAE
jgi:hypothetical protein